MKNIGFRKIGVFVTALYLMNRATYLSLEAFRGIMYYHFDSFYLETNKEAINYVDRVDNLLLYLVPLNPFFLAAWSPIVILNCLLLVLYYNMSIKAPSIIHKITQYYFSILSIFILSAGMFVALSYFNGFHSTPMCRECMYGVFLEGYIVYSPGMICGFLIGHSLFGLLWVLVLEKYIFKWNKE